MVRKLIKSLLSLSLIAPLSAFALGLGDVHLHSALSERLDADIELLSVSSAEADSLSISLASQETFDKVGLERPAILMYLVFEMVQDAAGDYTIKVTSKEPINEPFLDFLVEVDWKSGRVLREYTLLLDPPSGYSEATPAVTAPSTAPPTTSAAPTATVPAAAAVTPAAPTPAMQAAPASTPAAVTPAAVTPVSSTTSPMPTPAAAAGSLVYGPVKAKDTLWRIAEKLRPSKDISIQQMMVALLKANPYAFFDGNINRLKRGYVLRIDDPSLLTAMNRADAVREVARQTRSWQDYRERVAARAKQRSAAATAVEAKPGMAAATKSEPKLTLVAPEGKAADTAAPSGAAEGKPTGEVSEKLMLALESSAAQRKENDALKKRLEALEGQLQDMEKIVSLKDADLAALQQQLRKQGQGVALPSEKPASEVVTKPGEEPGLIVKPEEKPAEATMPVEAMKPEAKPADTAVPAEAKPELVKPDAAKPEVKKPVAKKPKPKRAPIMPVEEPSLIESLMADQMMLGIGGGVAIFILILLALIIKRRRKGAFQESILNAGSSSMMKASDEQGSETSFLSDLAISGMGPGTIQTDEGEVDPLTEADVFMAYGRNQQAEDVLKKALEKSPERADIAAKLLEVYYNSKDSAQFEALAEEAVGSLQGNDELWGKVLGMGHELCPDNVLFKEGAGAGAGFPAAAVESASDNVMDIGLDLDELSAEMEGDGGGGDMDLDLGLDFSDLDNEAEGDIDLGLDTAEPEADAALDMGDFGLDEPEAEESTDLDMDLGALDIGSGAEESADDGGMEFDFDLGDSDEAVAESGDAEIEFDLGELTTEGDEGGLDMSLDMDMDIGDFDLGDLDSSSEADSASIAASDDSLDLDMALDDLGDLGDLGDLDSGEDEMTTKLDLAQAYAEMGDAEGARSMLEEVVSAGSDEQKQQAQALIDKL